MHNDREPVGERVSAIPVGDRLTPRQLVIMRSLATGRPIKAVAEDVGISYQSVKNHLTDIYDKLDAAGMVDAFVKLGWLRHD